MNLAADGNDAHFGCPILNASACATTEDSTALIAAVYNPSSRARTDFPVRLPVRGGVTVSVLGSDGESVDAVELVEIWDKVADIPEREDSEAEYEVIFMADLPAMG